MTSQSRDLIAEVESRIRHGAAIRPGEALDSCNRLIAALRAADERERELVEALTAIATGPIDHPVDGLLKRQIAEQALRGNS